MALDHQDARPADGPVILGGFLLDRCDRFAPVRGQVQPHRRAMPAFAVALDMPAGLLGEAVDHTDAEAGSLAVLLRRQDRIEDAAEDPGRSTAPGSANSAQD